MHKINLKSRSSIFTLIQTIILALGLLFNNYGALSILEAIIILFFSLDKLGKGIIFREIVAFHSVLVLLIMPFLGYRYYGIENPLSRMWNKYMPIDEYQYYDFVFPAVLIYVLILCWPIKNVQKNDEGIFFKQKIKYNLQFINKTNIKPQKITLWSSAVYLLIPFLPISFQYIGYLFFITSFTGFLMLYLNNNTPNERTYLYIYILYILHIALSSTMFTIIIYMGMTISSFLFLNIELSFGKKLMLFVLISFFVLTLQSVKGIFRESSNHQSRALYLAQLLVDEGAKGFSSYTSDRFFPFYTRANQGFIVAKVIDYVPKRKDFDGGNYLGTALLSSLIPRVFWPDKPKAGGRFTTKYFTGEELVGNTSMNVSPVGEAYGSFGPVFGIIYMGLLAFFIRYVYVTFLALSSKIPLLIFWFPVIFFQTTYSMETDSLQIFNSLIKSSFFVFVLYTLSPAMFGIKKRMASL